jgi:hypothetical protein
MSGRFKSKLDLAHALATTLYKIFLKHYNTIALKRKKNVFIKNMLYRLHA